MAKYCFKVYLEDGTTTKWNPSDLEETDLHNMDMYALNSGGYSSFLSKIANDLKIAESSIVKVTILRIKKEIEFSLVNHNSYLKEVYPYLKSKKMNGYNNHLMDATVISSECKAYQEMKDYLFENIRRDVSFFLQHIYTYQNEFSKVLYQYGSTYNQGVYEEDEIRNLRELERKIEIELSIYKNYRGLCICRQKSEKMTYQPISKTRAKKLNVVSTITADSRYHLTRTFPTIEDQTAKYNQNYEEYLEPGEYEMMYGEKEEYPKTY